ncbi:GPR endopeptidase [Salipaludibacillus agaradhaerens]|uniref:Germination protease n=1 Tax=Salipaludibacillus agaradhaerens TaxID=76935 RepID=A0A9Q4B1X4_SALAG|nr:GPR endopeptidase [Salipaludibacillus agaradhaerens]MCR6096804.1 GPR endopeptidase [Salipaludibacillus agaradhaerens]MCR6113637.1 GPR endopeptidase [Salipaludibacillus agaradhaerens]
MKNGGGRMDKIDLSDYQVRTDLAVEAHSLAREREGADQQERAGSVVDGVNLDERDHDGIAITHVTIDDKAAERLGKKAGHYLTLQIDGIRQKDTALQAQAEKVFAKEFDRFLSSVGIDREATCLVVGLGNWNVTPDALGPLVTENLLITKHLFELQPENVQDGFRAVSAISPGVMGLTGIETSDIIFGVVEKVKPDFIIAVDALAARSIDRVNTTIQISDTGIHPGSGVGNKRKEISKEVLGIPVIAIGVPTVVDAVSITSDTIDYLLKHFGRETIEGQSPKRALAPAGMTFGEKKKLTEEDMPSDKERSMYLGVVGGLDEDEKRQLIHEVLSPLGHNLMVTPKEVDEFIEDMANLLAQGINTALHSDVTDENSGAYTH